jgi:DNA repair exonuclease SbcCD ATPase subunit
MKKLMIVVAAATLMFGCESKKLKTEIATLKEQNQALVEQGDDQDSVLTEFMDSFNEIGQNLAEIRSREASIELNSPESKNNDVRQQISEDIQIINDLMAQNKEKINELDRKLRNAWGSNAKLKKAMEAMKEEFVVQIEEKDGQIAALKTDLEKMSYTVEELNTSVSTLTAINNEKDDQISTQEATISQQTTALNTAYYVTGSSKQLEDASIINREGGVLGIGSSKQLSSDFDDQKFNQIDITQVTSIPLTGKKAQLITTHPNGSYKIEGEEAKAITNLVILDPERFWTSSKHLVVVVE